MYSINRKDAKDCVGKGWHPLIDKLYDKKPRGVYVVQVKEKFGGLRFYIGSAPMEYHKIITNIEKKSYTICEYCGAKGKYVEIGRWIKTLCDKCKEENK
jgi:hypothetical protein